MLKASRALSTHVGLLLILVCFNGLNGLIEIVEEQNCHDHEFRLTCRDLDTHIAILEAWYTSMDHYHLPTNATRTHKDIETMKDTELDRVYIYSSPKHNGVYEALNRSTFENFTTVLNSSDTDINHLNSSLGSKTNTEDVIVEFLNSREDCSTVAFSRSYGSLREGDKRRIPMVRDISTNLRAPLSYRCTGVNHCSFVLAEDYPPAADWAPGIVYIKYACFDDLLSVHYCNREVIAAESGLDSEGYIRTPGYPNFYIGGECRWRIRVNPSQKIRITLLDVSLRSIGPFEETCTDSVTVLEANGDIMLSSCAQVTLPLILISRTNVVDVIVNANSKGAYPKRGLLLHYKSVGCITLPAPSNGYLVYRNNAVAHYKCNVNFIFADSRQRARLLWCYNDNRWNDTVSFCVEEASLHSSSNDSIPSQGEKDNIKLPHNEANMIVDIVIPSLLIAALFIGNAFIVLIIYKYRKRKNDELEDEFNTIPLSGNGNMHSVGNPV